MGMRTKACFNPETGEVIRFRLPWMRQALVTDVLSDECRVHASHKDACDVNNILKRYERTGILPQAKKAPQFADVTHLQVDLTTAINRSRETMAKTKEYFDGKEKAKRQSKAGKAAGDTGPAASGPKAAPQATEAAPGQDPGKGAAANPAGS